MNIQYCSLVLQIMNFSWGYTIKSSQKIMNNNEKKTLILIITILSSSPIQNSIVISCSCSALYKCMHGIWKWLPLDAVSHGNIIIRSLKPLQAEGLTTYHKNLSSFLPQSLGMKNPSYIIPNLDINSPFSYLKLFSFLNEAL